ncbi:hypothetical protein HNR03_004923 [Pseudomonas sp. JAI111]|nr:hypothetical protein [Pseudomonas sp. JAI111]
MWSAPTKICFHSCIVCIIHTCWITTDTRWTPHLQGLRASLIAYIGAETVSTAHMATTVSFGSQALIHLSDNSLKHQSRWNFTMSASHVTDTAPQSPESM